MCGKVTVAQAKKYIDLIISGSSTYLAASIVGRERTSLRNAAARYYPRWKEQLPANHPVNTGLTAQGPRKKTSAELQPPNVEKVRALVTPEQVFDFVSRVDMGQLADVAAQHVGMSKNQLLAAAKRHMPSWQYD